MRTNAELSRGAQDVDQPGDLCDRWRSSSMIHGRPPQTVRLYNHLISRDDADQWQRSPSEKLAHRVFVLWSPDFIGYGHNTGDAQVLS